MKYKILIGLVSVFIVVFSICSIAEEILPHLQRKGTCTQLIVDGKPFLMRGGQFANNVYIEPKHIPYLGDMLDAYKGAYLNTMLVPISWKALEPTEGEFDFRMIDNLIDACRQRDLRLIVLWFGTIKNGGVGYAPLWVARDHNRFFRALNPKGKEVFAVSPFCEAAWKADSRAFTRLMEHIKEKDAGHYTVVMVQVENETGCQEIDSDRDHSEPANIAWNSPVPDDLCQYLKAHNGKLIKWLQEVWDRHGNKTSGTWPEMFGSDSDGQKIFMSYYIAQFIEHVASAGKAVYPLPFYVNDWLGSLKSPGGPIGGPDFQVMDIYRVAAPTISAYAPDIYVDNFKEWVAAFNQLDNPVLIPEAKSDARNGQQCWYAYFQHDSMLYSPYFLVPREADQLAVPKNLRYSNLSMSYSAIKEMDKIILSKQGLRPRELICFQLDRSDKPETVFQADFHGYKITAKATRGYGVLWEAEKTETPGFAAILKMGDNDFVVIGKTMQVEFSRQGYQPSTISKGKFQNNKWVDEKMGDIKSGAKIFLTEEFDQIDLFRIRFKADKPL